MMSEDRVGEIRISRRLLRIGNQAYPLTNIARVQTLWVEGNRSLATFREFVGLLLIIGVIVFVLPMLGLGGSASGLTLSAIVIAGMVVLWRLVMRERRFVLLIETAGSQIAALAGKDEPEIRRIEDAVVEAIENPPDQERILQVSGDIVLGDKIGRDKYQQGGSGNRIVSNW
ncbi:MAG: DUF6232 family protein [Actinomycetota bacterium]|nr:DUF6232 family protein [Actinomycetota bacterium]